MDTSQAYSGFSVRDLAEAITFYRDVLGVTVQEGPAGAELKFGDRHVFMYPKSNHVPAEFTILNFPVEDVDSTIPELTARGVEFLRYPGMPQDELGVMRGKAVNRGPDIAWFTDPSGNVLSVHSR